MWKRKSHPASPAVEQAQDGSGPGTTPAPASPAAPRIDYADHRMDVAKAAFAGVLAGVLGTLGTQFGIHVLSKVHLGSDSMAYVTNIAGFTGPIIGNDEGIEARLDKLTASRWGLVQYADPIRTKYYVPPRGLQSLKAQRGVLGTRFAVPDQATYRVNRLFTNVLQPAAQRPQGELVIIWFESAFDAQKWLLRGPSPLIGSSRTDTLWSGDMVVYYAPGSKDQGQQIKEWLTKVTQCPMSTTEC